MKLFGTTTSPYTRKIRILLRAAGVEATFVDTRTDEGAGALMRLAPVGKVPVVELEGTEAGEGGTRVLPDSGLIAAWLWTHHRPAIVAAGFSIAPDDWDDRARLVVVEGALDAAINRFYLLRDELPDQGYVTRQRDRVATSLAAIDAALPPFARPLTASALSLGCGLDWMIFRNVVDLAPYPRVRGFHEAWTASGVGAGTEPG
ncbi:MAG TPA: glutathione S-transferase N-terminal domain-containing protein [Polyangia bacterium]|nr:glutathione S-transferase N-terminal domain-containing protein [Polyangia bacterium]